jgi:hypothetical protein
MSAGTTHTGERDIVGQRWSSLAIASFAFSLVWLCGIGSVLGIVLGHASLAEIHRERHLRRSLPFSVMGLVLGYAGVAAAVYGWVVFDHWGLAPGN